MSVDKIYCGGGLYNICTRKILNLIKNTVTQIPFSYSTASNLLTYDKNSLIIKEDGNYYISLNVCGNFLKKSKLFADIGIRINELVTPMTINMPFLNLDAKTIAINNIISLSKNDIIDAFILCNEGVNFKFLDGFSASLIVCKID